MDSLTWKPCPTGEQLAAFCSGLLDEPVITQIADHLDQCALCESTVGTLHSSGHSTLLTWLRRDDVVRDLPSADELRQLEAKLKDVGLLPKVHSGQPPSPIAGDISLKASGNRALSGKPATLATESLPERIGPYFILRLLGKGGMANVLLGRDDRNNRLVAVKVPRSDRQLSERELETFLDEARHASELRHKSIIPVYDFNRTSDGICYVVMKYVKGNTVSSLLRSGPLSVRLAVRIARDVASVLHYIHKAGCVHRDIKPSNILVDDRGKVWLADFGLSLRIDFAQHRQFEFAGTLPYMSPEQLRGQSQRVDGRSDIWSLGVVLYEMLTGSCPFSGRSREALLVLTAAGPPQSEGVSKKLPSRRLRAVILRCLQPEVDDRFRHAGEISRALISRSRRLAENVAPFLIALALSPAFLSAHHAIDASLDQVVPIAFRETDKNFWRVSEDWRDLKVFSERNDAVLQLGTANANGIRLAAKISFDREGADSRDGTAGFFWKLTKLNLPNSVRDEYEGIAIRLHYSGTDQSCSVSIGRLRVSEQFNRHETVIAKYGNDVPIPMKTSEMHFAVVIEDGGRDGPAVRVEVDFEEVAEFDDRLDRLRIPEHSGSGYGVVCSNVPVHFGDIQSTFY